MFRVRIFVLILVMATFSGYIYVMSKIESTTTTTNCIDIPPPPQLHSVGPHSWSVLMKYCTTCQERIIAKYFASNQLIRKGFFVEVVAPGDISHTVMLEKTLGWRGIIIGSQKDRPGSVVVMTENMDMRDIIKQYGVVRINYLSIVDNLATFPFKTVMVDLIRTGKVQEAFMSRLGYRIVYELGPLDVFYGLK